MWGSLFKLGSLAIVISAIAGLQGCGGGKSAPCPPNNYNEHRRPPGYGWKARSDPTTRDIVYYGVDPQDHATVYVGQDSVFYKFSHAGAIQPGDIQTRWCPAPAQTRKQSE